MNFRFICFVVNFCLWLYSAFNFFFFFSLTDVKKWRDFWPNLEKLFSLSWHFQGTMFIVRPIKLLISVSFLNVQNKLTLVTFSEERYFLTMWDKKFYLKVVEKLGFRAQFSKTVPEQPNYYSTGICSIFPCHANVKCVHKIIIAYCIISWKNMLPIF